MTETADSHNETIAVRCCTCGLPINTQEIPRLEGEPCCQRCLNGFAAAVRRSMESPRSTVSLIPWLRREELGLPRAFLQTVSDVLSQPTRFFGQLPAVSQPWAPLFFAVICTLLFHFPALAINNMFVFPAIIQQLEQAQNIQEMPGYFAPLLNELSRQIHEQNVFSWLMLSLQFIIVNIFFAAWIQQFFVHLAGGRRGFEMTLQVRCYSLVGMFLYLIPGVGLIIGPIFWIAMNAVGLKEAHGLSGWISVFVATSPLLIGFLFSAMALSGGAA